MSNRNTKVSLYRFSMGSLAPRYTFARVCTPRVNVSDGMANIVSLGILQKANEISRDRSRGIRGAIKWRPGLVTSLQGRPCEAPAFRRRRRRVFGRELASRRRSTILPSRSKRRSRINVSLDLRNNFRTNRFSLLYNNNVTYHR